jgi:RNA polymerase sigma factor (sigma-70 family)
MPESDDITRLKRYVEGDESAFAALVERYVHLVYSTALRQAGNPSQAEEITQAVFIILARKAKSLGPRTILSGWLYQTARLAAANFLRSEIRRQKREQEAYMESLLNEPTPNLWQQIAPLLDDAMGHLSENDRNVVVLRFFQNQSAAEIGDALGIDSAAAQKRITRAVGRLRKFFAKRSVTHSVELITGAISTNFVQAAPVALAKSVTAVAIAKGVAASGPTLVLAKGVLKAMAWAKVKMAFGITAGILLAAGATTLVISQTSNGDKWTSQEIAQQSQDTYAALTSYSDNGTVMTEIAGKNIKTTFNIRLARPNLYRIDSIMTAGPNSVKGAAWSDGSGDYFEMKDAGKEKEKMKDMQTALAYTAALGNPAIAVPEIFFKLSLGDPMGFIVTGKVEAEREKDGQVGDVDCYVISSVVDTAKMRAEGTLPDGTGKMGAATETKRFWIGKRDHLIHQIQSSVDLASMTSASPARLSDADIERLLEKENKPVTAEAIADTRTRLEALSKKMQSVMKSGKMLVTETHEHIVVNQKFSPSDFQKAQQHFLQRASQTILHAACASYNVPL